MVKYIPTELEVERKNRIRLSLAAYTYEFENTPIISDAEYDSLSLKINLGMDTGNTILDTFFREEFSPDTGQWVRKHPELGKLKNKWRQLYKGN